jgi:hypothetical protein
LRIADFELRIGIADCELRIADWSFRNSKFEILHPSLTLAHPFAIKNGTQAISLRYFFWSENAAYSAVAQWQSIRLLTGGL